MRIIGLALLMAGCAHISDKHEDWRLDPDEDGSLFPEDCDDDDSTVQGPTQWYRDDDADGFGVEADMQRRCEQPEGFAAQAGDCDDLDERVYPEAEEQCDALDNDCNGLVDDGLDLSPWYRDSDGDGYGDEDHEVSACTAPDGHVANADDCDDTDAAYQRGDSPEIPYNGIDDNCDDTDGDGDWDGDGYWATDYIDLVAENDAEPMDIPAGMGSDCDDTNADIHPGVMDVAYDGIDADCAGDDDCDLDGDGFAAWEGDCTPEEPDCNDADPNVYPGATETCLTDYDDDCDGSSDGEDLEGCMLFYKDVDGDAYGEDSDSSCRCEAEIPYSTTAAGDCDDGNASVHPGAEDTPYDGVDSDCAGDDDCDADGDGFLGTDGVCADDGSDCDDTDPAVHPDATEDCSTEFDDDCDGDLNEEDALACTELFHDLDGDGFGDDGVTTCRCEPVLLYIETGGDCDDGDGSVYPGASEECDLVDTDCDGSLTDDEFADDDGDGTPDCVTADDDEDGVTVGEGDCDDGDSEVFPGATERCSTAYDDDCDGDTNDEGASGCAAFYADRDGDGYGDATDARCTCASEGFYTESDRDDCDDDDASVSPDATETCVTSYDDDCDGSTNAIDVTGCSVYYVDSDGDGHGDETTSLCTCEPMGAFDETTGGDCDDDDDSVHPGASEECDLTDSDCNGSLVDEFDDTDEDGTPDCVDVELAYGAMWRWDGLTDTSTGFSVAMVDNAVIVGAPTDDGESLRSRAYFFDSIHTGITDLETEAITMLSSGAEQSMGTSLLIVEDSSDIVRLLIGMGGSSAVAVLSPPSDDIALASGAIVDGESAGDCGFSMASGHLLSTPGPAIMIGCPRSGEGTKVVSLDALMGAGSGVELNDLGFEIALGLSGDPGSKEAGYAVAAGDLDGDGWDDAVVGARKSDWPAEHGGSVHVFLGPITSNRDVFSDDYRIQGDGREDFMGGEVKVVPDLSGDGLPDLVAMAGVGPTSWDSDSGSVHLFDHASLTSSTVLDPDEDFASVYAESDDASWERGKILVMDDADDDGQPDLVVGVPYDNLGGSYSGALYFVSGATLSGALSIWESDNIIVGEESHQLGRSLALGDLNDDGVDELLVGAPGVSRVYGFLTSTLVE